jgi:uncharacterized protein with PIN domain
MGAWPALNGAYLDASAVVKLLVDEAESEALDTFLADWPMRVSSELLRVELTCVCHRQGIPPAGADELLAGMRLLPLTPAVLDAARRKFSPPQRALDALHLASATGAREQLGCFVSYDAEQLAAAAALGWRVQRPIPSGR